VLGKNTLRLFEKEKFQHFCPIEQLKPSNGNPKNTQQKGWNFSLLKFHGGPVNKPYLIRMGK
jgi:hypothetical protein